jgi:Flp pilus assembly protein TadD
MQKCLTIFAQLALGLILITPAASGRPWTAQRQNESVARAGARSTYNETLYSFFDEVEKAGSAEALRTARVRARRGFLKAVSLDPSYALPYYNLGVLAEADEDWDSAIKYFEQFRKLDGTSDLSAKARQKLPSLEQARMADSTPEGKRKRQYEQLIIQGKALANLGLLKEVMSVAAEAIKIDGARWEAYALAGALLTRQGLCAEARSLMTQASALAPGGVKHKLAALLRECVSPARK